MEQNYKALLRDTFIILGLTFMGGFVIGFASPSGVNPVAIAISNLLFSCLGFFIAGCLTKESRFKHLTKVVFLVWLVGALNMLLGATIVQWVLSLVFLFVTMAIGGGLSLLFVKPSTPETT